jgi:hypothetical protein
VTNNLHVNGDISSLQMKGIDFNHVCFHVGCQHVTFKCESMPNGLCDFMLILLNAAYALIILKTISSRVASLIAVYTRKLLIIILLPDKRVTFLL